MEGLFGLLVLVAVLGAVLFLLTFRVTKEYERAIVFRLGRALKKPRGPGWFFVFPYPIDQLTRVELRVVTLDIPRQECITNDNVTVHVNAVAYFRVIDPMRAIIQVDNYTRATFQIAQTTLRSVIGQVELDELLAHRERVNEQLQHIIDEHTEPWGIKVGIVEVKDVELPDQMQRAMARQAEAEREKRAKIIHADGEFQAAQRLRDAANLMAQEPASLQLRYLQTLTEIAVEKNSTILFPVPIDLLNAFKSTGNKTE
jgi:regulator of protease activity HflC (stomatin/prohibitin superfamily)